MSIVATGIGKTDLRYPIGRYEAPETVTSEHLRGWIHEIEALPAKLRTALAGLTDEQLDTPYRPGGWTVRQVVHHLADSHVNSYVRFRLAATEDNPTIKPYDEAAWAELKDAKTAPVEPSLALLEGLHARWALFLKGLSGRDWKRSFRHPEYPNRELTLEWAAGLYDWHCRHHLAHITGLYGRAGWAN